MTKKLSAGVIMDGIAIPWSDDQNSLRSIAQYHEFRDLGLPQSGSTTKYRFHCRFSMTTKFPTGVQMDGIAISWLNYANSLSSIPNTTNIVISASRSPRAPPNMALIGDFL